MTSKSIRNIVTADMRVALEGCNWHLKNGKRHFHVYVEGHMVGIIPRRPKNQESDKRPDLNVISKIRKKRKELGR